MRRFSDDLRSACGPIWAAEHEHPFVRGIGDGTLPAEKFRFFIRQDYPYLVDYVRALAVACARAPDLELAAHFARRVRTILDTEMALHRAYASEWGIGPEELEAERMAPATRAYADFLLRTASLGSFPELAAALLPCVWGYVELGKALARGARPDDERYARWIDAYAGEALGELCDDFRTIVDGLAEDADETTRARMREAFLASSRHELALWDMAWQGEPR